jgi:hypothetical protein
MNMNDFKNQMSKSLFGRSKDEAISEAVCVCCGKDIEFSKMQEIDVKEFRISGMGPCCFFK